MKKSYLMIAAAATLLAACTNDEIRNGTLEYGESEIGFSTFASLQTKAADNNKNATALWNLENHQTSFNVWGWKKYNGSWVSTAVYNKGTVSYASEAWTASPIKFWDKSADYYYFYAAAPADTKWTLNNNSTDAIFDDDYLTYADFQLAGTNLDAATSTQSFMSVGDVDLMIAENKKVNRESYNKDNPDVVNLLFDHILSRLNVTIALKDGGALETNGATVKLTSFSITGSGITNTLKNKGSFNENAALGTDVLEDGTTKRWHTLSTEGTYNLAGKNISTTALTDEPVTIAQYLIIPQKITSEVLKRYKAITTDDIYYTAEEIAAATSGDDAYGKTTDDIKTAGTAAIHPYFQLSYTINDEPYYAYFNLANAFNVAAGNTLSFNEGWQNTLNIKIDADIITFDPQVYEWKGNEKDVTIFD